MGRKYYVYILGNYRRTVLYVGITSNLLKRVFEHKEESVEGFTKKYYVHDLLYYEIFEDSLSVIEREKQLKGWSRRKKDTLIMKTNPNLLDLYPSLCL